MIETICPVCDGDGEDYDWYCWHCRGTGRVPASEDPNYEDTKEE